MFVSSSFSIFIVDIDYINSVCPCAGLSRLNRSKGSGVGPGSDAKANKWMFKSAEYVLGRIKPKVLWGENAPMLFTKKGQDVVDGLRLVQVRLHYLGMSFMSTFCL